MGAAWSQQIESRYALRLTADLRAWFDDEQWRRAGGAEFRRSLAPAEILEPEPGLIWAGFLPPDVLPLVGNEYGDWICLRCDESSAIGELIQWSHAGGDWLPIGADLAEALYYDMACRFLHPRRPEFVEPEPPLAESAEHAEWARRRLARRSGAEPPAFWAVDPPPAPDRLLDLLDQFQIARDATARDRLLRALESPLKARADRRLARRLGVDWEPDFVRWLFDGRLIPDVRRRELANYLGVDEAEVGRQDWDRAARIAASVAARRSDLGWPFDVLGWAAERQGELEAATAGYLRGVQASIFADETTRMRTHWFADGHAKFAAARLAGLQDCLTLRQRTDPYLRLYLDPDLPTLRSRVRDYWLDVADRALREGRAGAAYDAYYRAGWDLGLSHVGDFERILDGLIAAASAAQWTGRRRLAELHRASL